MDAETVALIAKLALDDLEEIASARKAKSCFDAPLSDEGLSYQLQSENFKEWLARFEDARYAQSLDAALRTDSAILDATRAAEVAAAEDRRVAEMVSRGEALPPRTAAQVLLEQPGFSMEPEPPVSPVFTNSVNVKSQDERGKVEAKGKGKSKDTATQFQSRDFGNAEFFDKIDIVTLEDIDYDQNVSALALYSANNRSRMKASDPGPSASISEFISNKSVQCIICSDSLKTNQALHAPCKHYYCGDCVTSLVTAFVSDESLFPLRCCQEPIPVPQIDGFLTSALRVRFHEKQTEFSVPSQDRVYCSNPTCSAFLGSVQSGTAGSIACPTCNTETCRRCKQGAHGDEDCRANAATVALRAIAREAGWQTCPGCGTLVELSVGCFHMTCRCRTQFCYLCAALWKTCGCEQWEENRLVEDARHRMENELGARVVAQMAPEVRQRRVLERVEELRHNHWCDSHVWEYRHGGGLCEECNHFLPDFLKICRHCSLLACVRCTINRL